MEHLYTKAITYALEGIFTLEDQAMARTLTPEEKSAAAKLAAEIQAMSADAIREVAELLSTTPDSKLFGDTEFLVRAHVLKIVANSFTAHLAQKKTATTDPPSPVLSVNDLPSSKATATESR